MSAVQWSVKISGVAVAIADNVIKINRSIDNGRTCAFTVVDSTGTADYGRWEPVEVKNEAGKVQFSGFVHTATDNNLNPSTTNKIDVECYDQKWLADKAKVKYDYENELSGDIVADLHNNYLSELGVAAKYAQRRDTSATQWGLGTRSNTTGANNIDDGDLELSLAGDMVTLFERTTADLNMGSMFQVDTSDDHLEITTQKALQLSGTAQQGINQNYMYYKIWSGSQSILSTDSLVYSIWIASTSPKITGGIDLVCSDGSTLRDSGAFDQEGLICHPTTDLSGYADDRWFSRSIGLLNLGGKTASYVTIAQEGDANGRYDIWCAQIYLVDSSGTIKATFFNTSLTRVPTLILDAGYSDHTVAVVDAHFASGDRYSPSCDVSPANIIKSSIVSWDQSPANTDDATYVLVESSVDDAVTWQACTNHGMIPHLLAGVDAPASILFRQTLFVAGPDPTSGPSMSNLTVTVQPSYISSVSSDIVGFNATTSTPWDTQNHNGTMTASNGSLTINGNMRNWATDPNRLSGQTLYGTGTPTGNDGVQQPLSSYSIRTNASTDVRSRMDWAGQWGDFTCEVDVYLVDNVGNYGIVYRTTGWQNANDTYAYSVFIAPTGVTLGKGSNTSSGAGGFGLIATQPLTLQTGTWYHLKVVTFGSNHKVFVNDVMYINATDGTYTAPGYLGLRHFNSNTSGGPRHAGQFQNFGVLNAMSGVWTTNNISIGSLGTIGTSLITWGSDVPSNGTLEIDASIDAGTTWTACSNNAPIPILPTGTSVTGKNLLLRAQIATQNANSTPAVTGLSIILVSGFDSSGSRISPAMSLTPVGIVGATSLTWNGVEPDNTTIFVDSSSNGTSWTNAGSGASGSVAVPNITTQPDPVEDSFDEDTHTLYTSAARSGGSMGTWTFNTSQSRIDASGSGSVLLYAGLTPKDVDIVFDIDMCNRAGIVWRWTGTSNFYELVLQDNGAATSPNILQVFKTVAGTRTQIGSTTAISFVRGFPYRVRLTMINTTITAYFDGVQMLSVTDTSLTLAGGVGLSTATNGASSSATYYQLRIQSLGQSVVGQSLYTRVRLESTDPTQTPQVTDLTVSVRAPSIATGAFIPETQYSVYSGNSVTVGGGMDDQSTKSSAVWDITDDLELTFLDMLSTPAPFIVTGDIMLETAEISVEKSGDSYRNVQFIQNLTDTLARVESNVGDGIKQSFPTIYPIQNVSAITVNDAPVTFGVQDIDTGRDFYYKVGDVQFSQNANAIPLDKTQTTIIFYDGLVSNVSVELRDDNQVILLASIDGTDGRVEEAESGDSVSVLAGMQLAAARLDQYARVARTLTFTSKRDGLLPAMLAPVFLSQFKLHDDQFIITGVNTSTDATSQVEHACTMTDGSDVTTWSRYLLDKRKAI